MKIWRRILASAPRTCYGGAQSPLRRTWAGSSQRQPKAVAQPSVSSQVRSCAYLLWPEISLSEWKESL